MKADLHTHTIASDGILTYKELVDLAIELGYTDLAITDHDTFDSSFSASKYAKDKLNIITGLELSTTRNGESVHILGYFKSEEDAQKIIPQLLKTKKAREKRAVKMLDLLEEHKIKLDRTFLNKGNVITRGEISREIIRQGYKYSQKEIFDNFLANGKPCYIEAAKISTQEGIKLILDAGGFPVLAHPMLLTKNDPVDIIKLGVLGIEASYGPRLEKEAYYRNLAKKYHLIVTGGTDFHKYNDTHHVDFGSHFITDCDLKKFKEALYGPAAEVSTR